jgi:hypothetical protein
MGDTRPDYLRAAREDVVARRAEREAKLAADRVALQEAYDVDIAALDAELTEIEVAERIHDRWSAKATSVVVTPIFHLRRGPGRSNGEIPPEDDNKLKLTRKAMVLDAVRHIDPGQGALRHEIAEYISKHYNVDVPGSNISVYLSRLKENGEVEFNGNLWTPVGGWIGQ